MNLNNPLNEWICCSGFLNDPKNPYYQNKSCNKNLFKLQYIDGATVVQIKCPRCKTINDVALGDNSDE